MSNTNRVPHKEAKEEILPSFDLTGLSFEETERRQAILADIERRVNENGTHQAIKDPNRARQFMPFAALDGFTQIIKEVEDQNMNLN